VYHDVPSDWLVVITDVRGSTRAIEAGRYRDVNALGVSSIIALENALPDVQLPFVFGGDGATLLIPGSARERTESALRGVRRMAESAFEMSLRCGIVPVSELRSQGQRVAVAKFRVSPHVVLAMFTGEGFVTAERWIKDPVRGVEHEVPGEGPDACNLEGFECRWQPVKSTRGTILSLLVSARSQSEQEKSRIYRQVIQNLESIFGVGAVLPISESRLHIGGPFQDFSTEARVRSGEREGERFRLAHKHARKKSSIGKVLMALGKSAGGFDGAPYKSELVQNSDFRKFDDTLRMVVDVSDEQFAAVERMLRAAFEKGELAYGLHRSKQALLTCFVRAYQGNHVHFVDGSHGGYALAAKQLKEQLKRFDGEGQ
jgi:hypothetical protein